MTPTSGAQGFEEWRRSYCPDSDREGDCRAAFLAAYRAGLLAGAEMVKEVRDPYVLKASENAPGPEEYQYGEYVKRLIVQALREAAKA